MLATRHGINPKTVAKWRERTTVTDAAMGPTPASTMLPVEQEAMAVAFRQYTFCRSTAVYTRSKARFRGARARPYPAVFSGPASSRLPLSGDGKSPPKKKFKNYPIDYLHIDFAEVQTAEGKQ